MKRAKNILELNPCHLPDVVFEYLPDAYGNNDSKCYVIDVDNMIGFSESTQHGLYTVPGIAEVCEFAACENPYSTYYHYIIISEVFDQIPYLPVLTGDKYIRFWAGRSDIHGLKMLFKTLFAFEWNGIEEINSVLDFLNILVKNQNDNNRVRSFASIAQDYIDLPQFVSTYGRQIFADSSKEVVNNDYMEYVDAVLNLFNKIMAKVKELDYANIYIAEYQQIEMLINQWI